MKRQSLINRMSNTPLESSRSITTYQTARIILAYQACTDTKTGRSSIESTRWDKRMQRSFRRKRKMQLNGTVDLYILLKMLHIMATKCRVTIGYQWNRDLQLLMRLDQGKNWFKAWNNHPHYRIPKRCTYKPILEGKMDRSTWNWRAMIGCLRSQIPTRSISRLISKESPSKTSSIVVILSQGQVHPILTKYTFKQISKAKGLPTISIAGLLTAIHPYQTQIKFKFRQTLKVKSRQINLIAED